LYHPVLSGTAWVASTTTGRCEAREICRLYHPTVSITCFLYASDGLAGGCVCVLRQGDSSWRSRRFSVCPSRRALDPFRPALSTNNHPSSQPTTSHSAMLQLPLLGARAFQATSSRAFSTLPSSSSPFRSPLVRHLQQARFRPTPPPTPQALSKRFASSGWSQAPRASDFEAQGGWAKVGKMALAFGAGTIVVNLALNRETRESLSPFERSHLNSTFMYT
jgi:hypothetical protein